MGRFVGIVEFFDRRKGFGFISPKEDFNFADTDFVANKKESRIYVAREDIKTTAEVDSMPSLKDKAEVEFTLFKNTEEDKTKWAAADVTKVGGESLGEDDFKVFVRGEKRKRQPQSKKKGKKGKKGKGKKFKGGFQMGGQTFIPMGSGGTPQIMMVNGQAFMVMPQGMNMGMNMMGMNMMGGRKSKRRKKNKKKQNKGN